MHLIGSFISFKILLREIFYLFNNDDSNKNDDDICWAPQIHEIADIRESNYVR